MHVMDNIILAKNGVRKGSWTKEEDNLLRKCIHEFGEGQWHQVPSRAGLNRCRKSCRLRWLNYLRPDIKRGDFAWDEVDLIIRLHKLLGNRWSLIAGRLPGRTANDVKNYWNTHLRKMPNIRLMPAQQHQNNELKNIIIKPRPRTFKSNTKTTNIIADNEPNNPPTYAPENVAQWWENLLAVGGDGDTTSFRGSSGEAGGGLKKKAMTSAWVADDISNSTWIRNDGEFGLCDFHVPIGIDLWNF